MLFELAHDVGDGRRLLSDRDIHARQVLALLVDDRVDRHRGLAGLAVADDQLALAAADRHHRVDRLQPGLHRLRHWLPRDHARRDLFDDVGHLGVDRTLAIDRLAERIDDAADEFRAHRHFENAPRALDGVAFGDLLVFAQHDGADRIALEVERQPVRVAREFEHLALHRVRQSVHAADAIGDRYDGALRALLRAGVQVLYPGLDEFADFGRVQLHGGLMSHALAGFARTLLFDSSVRRTVRSPSWKACPVRSRRSRDRRR